MSRQQAQSARRGSYYPDTMSRPARRLAEMRQVWGYWHDRTGPASGYALGRDSMLAIAEGACREIAARIIADGAA